MLLRVASVSLITKTMPTSLWVSVAGRTTAFNFNQAIALLYEIVPRYLRRMGRKPVWDTTCVEQLRRQEEREEAGMEPSVLYPQERVLTTGRTVDGISVGSPEVVINLAAATALLQCRQGIVQGICESADLELACEMVQQNPIVATGETARILARRYGELYRVR